jgi:hypothetical protein
LSTDDLIDAAHDYISRGLRVIALTGKAPNVGIHRRGLYDALGKGDEHLIDGVFRHADTTGIGILTSHPLVVVDIDSELGAENWKRLVGDEFIPDRWAAKTAHGLHLYYFTTEETGTFKPFGKIGGVDLKGHGGYVAAPPSWHPGYPDEGIAPGNLYQWLLAPSTDAPLPVPAPLARVIETHNFDAKRKAISAVTGKRVRHEQFYDGKLWATWGFEHLIDGMLKAGDGNRNNYLHWAAATMAEEGAVDEEFEDLREAARKAGLSHIEVSRTIRSARHARG